MTGDEAAVYALQGNLTWPPGPEVPRSLQTLPRVEASPIRASWELGRFPKMGLLAFAAPTLKPPAL